MNDVGVDHSLSWVGRDRESVWHPYSAIDSGLPVYPVVSADGVRIKLADGRELIDGMASWWCAIHGYNHPVLNKAVEDQLQDMAHVMFGGLTHRPAVDLVDKLVEITPPSLQSVFLADSGSVSVEVAMKMAIQYWAAQQQSAKQRFITIRGGYHGDTLGAMSVCDPVTGMHSLFENVLPQQIFVDRPSCVFGEPCTDDDFSPMEKAIEKSCATVAAVILEPIVQGAGGMFFYSAGYLQRLRKACDAYGILLIMDEIATGFGRTGKLFACEHAQVSPDIMCVGKSLTGGYMTLSATLTTREVSSVIASADPGVFMHGPTFMGNPLACAVALASINLLLKSSWQQRIAGIENGLRQGLSDCIGLNGVTDVRVLGAIGVVELTEAVDMQRIQPLFVDLGVWVRPFGKLIYLMPPFIISERDLAILTRAVVKVVSSLDNP